MVGVASISPPPAQVVLGFAHPSEWGMALGWKFAQHVLHRYKYIPSGGPISCTIDTFKPSSRNFFVFLISREFLVGFQLILIVFLSYGDLFVIRLISRILFTPVEFFGAYWKSCDFDFTKFSPRAPIDEFFSNRDDFFVSISRIFIIFM